MWILSFISDLVASIILIAGILGVIFSFFISYIPVVKTYELPLKIISIIFIAVGSYFMGKIEKDKEWAYRMSEVEVALIKSKNESAEKNLEIQSLISAKSKVIYKQGNDIISYIDREIVKKEEVVKYIEQCPIPKDIIDVHNKAVDIGKNVGELK